jgi:hypothetical protein
MNPVDCPFESEVLAAVVESRWPERANAELRAHVQSCEICCDVAAAACAIGESRDLLRASAVLPDSGRVWWLAQTRARREAMQAAGRPITAVQLAAFGCAAGLLGACFGATSVWFQSALQWIARAAGDVNVAFAEHGLLVVGLAAMVLLVPVAVRLASGRD